jgi:NhaP-type Na+/H+ or K+/H+ antiporter
MRQLPRTGNILMSQFSGFVVDAEQGVLFSAGVTATGMHYLAHWQWFGATVFCVLVAATDPVSVIATFKEAKVEGRLLVLIETESLFNDGTAAIVFGIVVALAGGYRLTPLAITSMLEMIPRPYTGPTLAMGARQRRKSVTFPSVTTCITADRLRQYAIANK